MNLLEKMNCAINYVEDHITDDIDLAKIAQLAYCSTYNFQRMFSFIADISIVEYIRRRRLTLAAFELQQSNIKVIDLSVKYGYDSPVSFARAFQAMHGVTPTESRNSNVSLKAFSRISFQITIKGVSEMNYRIVKTQPLKLFGLEGIVSTIGESDCYPHEGAIWQENHKNGKYEKLFIDAGEKKHILYDTMFTHNMCRIHGLINYKKINDTTYGYMQCSLTTDESKTDGYEVVEIPATTWAVFPFDVPNWDVGTTIGIVNKRFYSEWLPTSEFEKAEGPEFEIYGDGTPEMGYMELWIPVIKK